MNNNIKKADRVATDIDWDSLPATMTARQAADILNATNLTLRTWIHRGDIPAFRLGGSGQYRILKSVLRKIVEG